MCSLLYGCPPLFSLTGNEGPGPIVPLLDTEGHPTFDELGRQRFFNRASGETLSGRPVDHGASSTRVMIVDHDDDTDTEEESSLSRLIR